MKNIVWYAIAGIAITGVSAFWIYKQNEHKIGLNDPRIQPLLDDDFLRKMNGTKSASN